MLFYSLNWCTTKLNVNVVKFTCRYVIISPSMPFLGLSHHLDLKVTFYVRHLCLTSGGRAVEEASVNQELSLLVESSDFHCTQDIDFCHLHILLCPNFKFQGYHLVIYSAGLETLMQGVSADPWSEVLFGSLLVLGSLNLTKYTYF